MSDLILHQYAGSPFAEKVRAILGYKRLPWRAVDIPIVMPKPDLTALTGGYRKTPVLQVGCDVYCDTSLIARVLDRLHPGSPVHRPSEDGTAVPAGRWLDHHLFFTVIAHLFDPAVAAISVQALGGPEGAAAFAKDRGEMMASARVGRPTLPQAKVTLQELLTRFEAQLSASGPFLARDGAPGWIDFCVYHPLWMFSGNSALAPQLAAYPRVSEWLDRMRGFGHGEPSALDSGEAVEIARQSKPVEPSIVPGPPLEGLEVGDPVSVAADDYALEPTIGTLAHVGLDEVALERTDGRAGRVVVHFPRAGFKIERPA